MWIQIEIWDRESYLLYTQTSLLYTPYIFLRLEPHSQTV